MRQSIYVFPTKAIQPTTTEARTYECYSCHKKPVGPIFGWVFIDDTCTCKECVNKVN